MKKTLVYLLAAVLLACTATTFAQAQKARSITMTEADQIFQEMMGKHLVKSLSWQPGQQQFFEVTGQGRYSRNANRTLREEYDIIQPDGSTLHYEGMLRFCEEKDRFEFVQFDPEGNAVVMLVGKWYPDFSMIQMEPVKRQWKLNGKRRNSESLLVLQYFFLDDGSFKKVFKSNENTGDSSIVYEYHCLKNQLVGR